MSRFLVQFRLANKHEKTAVEFLPDTIQTMEEAVAYVNNTDDEESPARQQHAVLIEEIVIHEVLQTVPIDVEPIKSADEDRQRERDRQEALKKIQQLKREFQL